MAVVGDGTNAGLGALKLHRSKVILADMQQTRFFQNHADRGTVWTKVTISLCKNRCYQFLIVFVCFSGWQVL